MRSCHTKCDGSAHPPRIISLIWIHFPELEVRWNANPTDYQDFSSTQVNNVLRYNHRHFPLHVPHNKNDLFGETTLIQCHFGKMKSVITATNEITGPEENSTSCEMMFSDHLNETDEKAVYKRRLPPPACVRCVRLPNLRYRGMDFQIWDACAGICK